MKRAFKLLALSYAASLLLTEGAVGMGDASVERDKGTVLVAGASGKTGRHVMEILSEDGYTPRGMTRNPERAAQSVGAGYDWVRADATDPATLTAAVEGADYVICTIGSQEPRGPNSPEFVDYGGVKNLIDAAVAANVKHFVLVSSQGATDDSPDNPLNKMFSNVLIWKLKGENHLRASGLNYTVVRPGGLEGYQHDAGTVGLRFDQGDDSRGAIPRKDVAAVLVAALSDADANKKTFELYQDGDAPANNWQGAAFASLAADE